MAPVIIGISVIKNEADILETFVRHNLGFVDALAILDNASSDRSRDILVRLMREGLPLIVIDDPDPAHRQSEKLTGLAMTVAGYFDPDWVIPLDADEFIRPMEQKSLTELLADLPEGSVGQMGWVTYAPTPDDDPSAANVLERITHHRIAEKPQYYKVIIPRSILGAGEFIIDFGNHAVRHRNGSYPYPHYVLRDLALAHVPIRSSEQILAKAFVSWLANLCHQSSSTIGWHKEGLYRRFVENRPLSPAELTEAGAGHAAEKDAPRELVVDPVAPAKPFLLTCVDLMGVDPARQVVRMAESLAERLRVVTDETTGEDPYAYHAGTPLSAADHAGLGSVDKPPFRYLVDLFGPVSALWLGPGSKTYPEFFRACGVADAAGVEVDTATGSFEAGRVFDLVICSETGGAVEPETEKTFIKTVGAHAGRAVLFSSAQQGQPGGWLMNPRSPEHWMELWRREGFEPLVFHTLAFRALATFLWLKHNALVLVRATLAADYFSSPLFGPGLVERTGHPPESWPCQKPGEYAAALTGRSLKTSFMKNPEQAASAMSLEIARLLLKRAKANMDRGLLAESAADLETALSQPGAAETCLVKPWVTELISSLVSLAGRLEEADTLSRVRALISQTRQRLERG